jgi:signal transduction histidine kinase/ligand-binding sensor domain-containing protein
VIRPVRRLFAVLHVMLALPLSAAAPNSAWSLHVWQSDDGLPNNNITGLAQTADGFLWAANPSRLVRFDGVRFETFSSQSLVPGYNQRVNAVLRSRKGGLWLGMDHGPLVYLDGRASFVITNNLPDLAMQTLVEDKDGDLWVTFRGEIVCRVRNRQVTQSPMLEGLPAGSFCSLAVDGAGDLWYAKGGQIGIFRNGKFQMIEQLGGYNTPIRICGSAGGGIWIAAELQLFRCTTAGTLQRCGTFPGQAPVIDPNVVVEARDGSVWIGTSGGLVRYEAGVFELVPTSHGEILSLLEDREGSIWAGTGGGGLNRIRPRAVGAENLENVQSVCEDSRGVLWAATQDGLLARHSAGGWEIVSTNILWKGGRASCVAADRAGHVWIGTRDHALYCWDGDAFSARGQAEGVLSHNIHCLLGGAAGEIWIAGNAPDALQRLQDGKVETLALPADLRTMRTMTEDSEGNVWIGTVKGVLIRVHGNQVTNETAATGIEESALAPGSIFSIRSVHATPDGSVWIGYAGGGLGRLKGGRFARITSEQGLYDDYVSQIVSDGKGWLWCGADHGIFKLREQDFENVIAGKAPRVQSICYGRGDGLTSLQANFGNSPGAFRSRDGRLWMPMRSALAVVDPERFKASADQTRPLLSRVSVDEQTAAWYGGVMPVGRLADLGNSRTQLRVPPSHRRLEFEFTATSLNAPENVQFRYRLDGYDAGWIDSSTERSARYSRLPAGDYRFEVRACGADGGWNDEAAVFAFSVTPFFWQTWWFRLAVLGAFTGATIGIVRYVSFRRLRLRVLALEQQAALDKERARIARDLHDDLGSRLTKVVLLSELARDFREDPAQAGENARRVSEMAREVIKSLDETVWAVNPRNDTLPHMIDYIGQFAVDFLHTAGVRCRLDFPRRAPERMVSAEVRHNLFLLVKEAVNNVVRHATATEVTLRVVVDEKAMHLAIEDDGQGFAAEPTDALADGLRNMRRRMEEIGGRFGLESRPGSGTKIIVSIPWPAVPIERH